VGVVGIIVLLATNKTDNGRRSYLYPLIPFNGKALLSRFILLRKDRIAGAEGVREEEGQEQ
jgi:hypothetical protein